MLQEPFDQGLEYEITMEGRESQEDRRTESPRMDGKRGVNLDNLLEESQEREENQAKITLEEPHSQETGSVEDPDPGDRSGEEVQELHAYQTPPPEARPQEHRDWGWEDAILRQESDGQEARNEEHRYLDDPEAKIRVCRPHPQEPRDKECQEDPPRNPREG